jgi:hypothetical protein
MIKNISNSNREESCLFLGMAITNYDPKLFLKKLFVIYYNYNIYYCSDIIIIIIIIIIITIIEKIEFMDKCEEIIFD